MINNDYNHTVSVSDQSGRQTSSLSAVFLYRIYTLSTFRGHPSRLTENKFGVLAILNCTAYGANQIQNYFRASTFVEPISIINSIVVRYHHLPYHDHQSVAHFRLY